MQQSSAFIKGISAESCASAPAAVEPACVATLLINVTLDAAVAGELAVTTQTNRAAPPKSQGVDGALEVVVRSWYAYNANIFTSKVRDSLSVVSMESFPPTRRLPGIFEPRINLLVDRSIWL